MRVLAVLLVLATACGADIIKTSEGERAQIMATALDHLVSEEFGVTAYPLFLIEDQTIALGRFPALPEVIDDRPPPRPIANGEKRVIEEALARYAEVRWISDPGDWFTEDGGIADGAAILSVGQPIASTPGHLVPVGLVCGNLCGLWLTYRVELVQDAWQVTGTEGPIAIS